jgi:hypothetical protein
MMHWKWAAQDLALLSAVFPEDRQFPFDYSLAYRRVYEHWSRCAQGATAAVGPAAVKMIHWKWAAQDLLC